MMETPLLDKLEERVSEIQRFLNLIQIDGLFANADWSRAKQFLHAYPLALHMHKNAHWVIIKMGEREGIIDNPLPDLDGLEKEIELVALSTPTVEHLHQFEKKVHRVAQKVLDATVQVEKIQAETDSLLPKIQDLISKANDHAFQQRYKQEMASLGPNDEEKQMAVKWQVHVMNSLPIAERFLKSLLVNHIALYYSALRRVCPDCISVATDSPTKRADRTPVTDTVYTISINDNARSSLFGILSHHFPSQQRNQLEDRLKGQGDKAAKLLFLGNGNRLADAFAQLIYNNLIAGSKADLENWIAENFQYTFRGVVYDFKPKYLNDLISTTYKVCQKPILKVECQKDGTITVVAINSEKKS